MQPVHFVAGINNSSSEKVNPQAPSFRYVLCWCLFLVDDFNECGLKIFSPEPVLSCRDHPNEPKQEYKTIGKIYQVSTVIN